MKTCLDCIPCFFKQALEASRIANADETIQRKILNETARAIPGFPLESTPPEMARTIYRIVREYTGVDDPYLEIKNQSNHFALKIYDQLMEKVKESHNPLFTAVELAIAGNIIDYGVKNSLNIKKELERIISEEEQKIKQESRHLFQYQSFKTQLENAKNLLYLADNAGEIVFDRVLLEEIHEKYPNLKICFAVKEKPAINDAMMKDAKDCGLDKVAEVISSGSDAPGTLLPYCSDDFNLLFQKADMVISKGQGNYETLSDEDRPVFFLLLAKCPVIANHLQCELRDVILTCPQEK